MIIFPPVFCTVWWNYMPPTKSEDMTTKWSCVFKHYPLCNSLNELFINYCSKWQTSENSLDIVQHPALIITTFYVQQTKTLWIISIYFWLTLRTFPGNQNKKSIVQYYCHCMQHCSRTSGPCSLQSASLQWPSYGTYGRYGAASEDWEDMGHWDASSIQQPVDNNKSLIKTISVELSREGLMGVGDIQLLLCWLPLWVVEWGLVAESCRGVVELSKYR